MRQNLIGLRQFLAMIRAEPPPDADEVESDCISQHFISEVSRTATIDQGAIAGAKIFGRTHLSNFHSLYKFCELFKPSKFRFNGRRKRYAFEGHFMADRKKEAAARFDAIRRKYKATLDPSDYPGQISLIFELDTEVCLITVENETIIGELSSFDSFGNVVLRRARGRIYSQFGFQDLFYGHCYFRAERVLLIGQIDKQKQAAFFAQAGIRPPPEAQE
jgi:small nuclear ribonucleoprotein (snRNP)-like protein